MYEFNFKVYNNRRDCNLNYNITLNDKGWNISHIAIKGDCDPEGKPYFYNNFKQDYINYPSGFGDHLAWLWSQYINQEFSEEEIQTKLQELADWVSACEKSRPKWKGYNC